VSYSAASGLTVRRLQTEIGAVIEGTELCSPIPPEIARDIRQALLDHGVIFCRDQPVSYEDQLALVRVFGEPFNEGILADKPEVMPLKSNAEQTNPAGGHWHSDGTYYEVAPPVSILVGLADAEGTELLRYLSDRFRRTEYQMRWSWHADDIAVWDNRQVQHCTVRNEAGPRYVERIMVAGTPSVGLSDEHEPVAVAG
jgi:alpha-ketoglutarate-dependent taurine dioxygenase